MRSAATCARRVTRCARATSTGRPPAWRRERLIGMIWDIGLEIGHSVRTIEACVETAQADITIETSLLEARLLAGNAALFRRLTRAIEKIVDPAAFLKAK